MALAFSEGTNNTGIVQQTRNLMRVDATQWPTSRIVNSCNNYLDVVIGYMIGADKMFQADDSNHTALPEGTAALTINVSDYSWLTDQQGNAIITLLGVSRLDSVSGKYIPLDETDRSLEDTSTYGTVSGTPTKYDKIADNIIRLDTLPPATVSAGLKFYFQRTGSYFAATDTTKSPGVSPLLHRGFVIASAYDGALTLGLENLNALGIEMAREEKKMKEFFAKNRNRDSVTSVSVKRINFR